MSPAVPVIVLLFSSFLWALTWMPLKYFAAAGIGGLWVVFVAFGVASLAIMPMLLRILPGLGRHWRMFLLMVLLGGFANFAFTLAIVEGDVIRVMMLFFLAPVWGVLGGRFFLGEKIDLQRKLAVATAIVGGFLVLGGMEMFSTPPTAIDVLALAAGFAFAMNNVACRKEQVMVMTGKIGAVFLGCTLMSGIYLLIGNVPVPQVDNADWLWLVGYGLAWMLVATLATQWAVTHMEAGRASIILISELLVSVATASIFGGEQMSQIEMIGGVLILLATVLEAVRIRRN
ncbi:MAG: DMT family transporter [Gammaproteobacteria bacterium]|nr:DMT family transporter [Gammaproteobacteria bacterium]